jgi:hypothetical protein
MSELDKLTGYALRARDFMAGWLGKEQLGQSVVTLIGVGGAFLTMVFSLIASLANTALGQAILAGLIVGGGAAYERTYFLEQGRAEVTATMTAKAKEAAEFWKGEAEKQGKAAYEIGVKDGKAACKKAAR